MFRFHGRSNIDNNRVVFNYVVCDENVLLTNGTLNKTTTATQRRRTQSNSNIVIELAMNIKGISQDERYDIVQGLNYAPAFTLYSMQKGLSSMNYGENIETYLTIQLFSYATADFVSESTFCEDLDYPRICRQYRNDKNLIHLKQTKL